MGEPKQHDPLNYRVFTEAVLMFHTRVDFPDLGRSICSCGWGLEQCRIRHLASQLGLLDGEQPRTSTG